MRPNWPNSVVSGSRAKIEDIQTLRDEINRVRGVVGLGPISWPPITTMKAADLIEMRDAIQEIWSDNSLNFGSLPPWTDGTPTANTVDPAVHIMDLRTWVSRAGDYPPVQGIDTFSWNQYGAAVDQWAIVNSAWRSNLLGLTPDSGGDAAPLPNRIRSLRCPITAREAALPNQRQPLSGDPNWRSRFQSALSIYTSTSPSLRIYAMFNAETFYNGDPQGNALRSGFIQVNDTFQGQTIVVENTTPFIEDFSTEVAFLVNWLRPLGVNDFIIWNEPNVSEGDEPLKAMSASHYAAMLRRCWRKVMLTTNGWLPISQRPNLCWGGVLFVVVDTENGPVSGFEYLWQI